MKRFFEKLNEVAGWIAAAILIAAFIVLCAYADYWYKKKIIKDALQEQTP